ncbi:GNAT family N-acetyltransferase [Ekhidna lutea]|uniref:GNAT family N-acetyltransferase n=1 Tax=Ekhidna lutea TaxID=447679 RepID=UPI0015C65497|nr:GNAT family N-acetyltransferase [Ekhidna lutea]
MASVKTKNNEPESRFEIVLDGAIAFIDYKVGKGGGVYMVHTEVPKEFEGQGVGHKLVRESLEIIEENECKIVPLCPFVRSFLLDNRSDYEHLLAERAKL